MKTTRTRRKKAYRCESLHFERPLPKPRRNDWRPGVLGDDWDNFEFDDAAHATITRAKPRLSRFVDETD